ncbi:hypothetical protein [Bacillus xiapuensis]|uniref:hypothetical protein n=1 Tax=Bacillus xiapuensis TaxID=2014075 RepID=UPI0018E1F979|nr:hypothetical protein [Bacillus xiapuensis]
MLYQVLVYIHVMSAVLSIGPFFVLIPLVRQLYKVQAEVQAAYLSIFTFLVRLVKHAGHVLVASGILLILKGPWSWTASWIVMTVLVMASSVFFLARAFSPTLKKWNEPDSDKKKLADKLHQSVWIYILLLMLMLWFMVAKPIMW